MKSSFLIKFNFYKFLALGCFVCIPHVLFPMVEEVRKQSFFKEAVHDQLLKEHTDLRGQLAQVIGFEAFLQVLPIETRIKVQERSEKFASDIIANIIYQYSNNGQDTVKLDALNNFISRITEFVFHHSYDAQGLFVKAKFGQFREIPQRLAVSHEIIKNLQPDFTAFKKENDKELKSLLSQLSGNEGVNDFSSFFNEFFHLGCIDNDGEVDALKAAQIYRIVYYLDELYKTGIILAALREELKNPDNK